MIVLDFSEWRCESISSLIPTTPITTFTYSNIPSKCGENYKSEMSHPQKVRCYLSLTGRDG